MDAGYTHVVQPDFPVSDGASLGALLARTSRRLTFVGSGTAVLGTNDSTVALGLLAGAWRPFLRGGWQTELGATGTALRSTGLRAATGANAYARQQYATRGTRGFRGAWAGIGAGTVDDALETRPTWTADAGVAWGWRASGLVSATATHVRTREFGIEIGPGEVARGAPVRYTDAAVALRWSAPRLDLDAAAGLRLGGHPDRLAADPSGFGSVTAAWWVLPRTAVVVAAGRALSDPMRGTARARYATAALRLSLGATRAPSPRRSAATNPIAGRGPSVSVARVEGSVLLHVHAPGAQRVEVMGDFTEWQPAALTRGADGAWTHTLAIAPGAIRVLVRVDGGAWEVPRNASAARDEFGGTVGLVVVP